MILPIWTSKHQKTQNDLLQKVIDTVSENTANGVSSLVIFDLDGTLFDNRPRTVFILREIAAKHEEDLPELTEAIESYRDMSVVEYSLEHTLSNLKVRDAKEREFIKREWEKRFFSDEYQKYDIPLAGARTYVSHVHRAGATVIYLTGRDADRMLVGMTESLRLFGFPVGIVGTMTIVKKAFEERDEVFKSEVVSYLRRLGKVEGIFENEPLNSNLLRKAFPEAESFMVLTQHRADAPPLNDGIAVIKDFRMRQVAEL